MHNCKNENLAIACCGPISQILSHNYSSVLYCRAPMAHCPWHWIWTGLCCVKLPAWFQKGPHRTPQTNQSQGSTKFEFVFLTTIAMFLRYGKRSSTVQWSSVCLFTISAVLVSHRFAVRSHCIVQCVWSARTIIYNGSHLMSYLWPLVQARILTIWVIPLSEKPVLTAKNCPVVTK